MKLKNIYIFTVLLFAAYIFMGHSQGRADSQGWGNTGAPGDETLPNGVARTCITCHGGNDISVALDIDILNQDGSALADNMYTPGATYDMTVTVNNTGGTTPTAYGFQMVALTDSNEEDVATWANASANTEIAIASNTGRSYVEQTSASTSNTFTMEWTAPTSGSGDVTFYSCGNGVNLNGSSVGDGAACTTLSLTEGETSSVANLNSDLLQVALSPNPASDRLQITIDTPFQDDFQLNILSLNGQQIHSQTWSSGRTSDKVDLDISNFATGMYLIQLTNQEYSTTSKWVKL